MIEYSEVSETERREQLMQLMSIDGDTGKAMYIRLADVMYSFTCGDTSLHLSGGGLAQ